MEHSKTHNKNNIFNNLVFTILANLATSDLKWLFYFNYRKIDLFRKFKSLVLDIWQKTQVRKSDAKNSFKEIFSSNLNTLHFLFIMKFFDRTASGAEKSYTLRKASILFFQEGNMLNLILHKSENNRKKFLLLLGSLIIFVFFGLFYTKDMQKVRANPESFTEEIMVYGVIPLSQTFSRENALPVMLPGESITQESYNSEHGPPSERVGFLSHLWWMREAKKYYVDHVDKVVADETILPLFSEFPTCPSGITSFFHLDESSSPYFDAFSGLQGTCTNCPLSAPGLVGNAQQFDGEFDEVDVAPDASFNWSENDSFSIEFWVWKDTECTGTEVIIGRDDSSSYLHMWIGCISNGTVYFQLRDKTGAGNYVASNAVLNNGQWHHIAAVRDAITDTNYIYLDGIPTSITYNYSYGFDSATAPLNLGYLNLSGHYRFDGLLDEVVIYNRALTANEIQDHVDFPETLSSCTIAPSTYSLIITKVGEGSVTSEPVGIDCGTVCSADFEENSTVALTATPAAGWAFSGWSGDCSGTICQVSMDQARNVTATFEPATPIITSSPVTTAEVNNAYVYNVTATGNPAPIYSLTISPDSMTIDPNSGLIEWIPASAGDYAVTVTATNSEGTDAQSFTITVFDVPICPSGITSFFHLDEVASPFFDVFSGLQGTCTNCPVSGLGLVGNAQQFDGIDDEVDVAPDISFDWGAEDSFSIEFWVWKDTECTGNEVIVGRDDGSSNLQMWIGCSSIGTAFFQLKDINNNAASIGSIGILNNGQWHHIAAVRDATTDTNTIYLDGVAASTTFDYPNGFYSATAPLNIGYLNLSGHYRFDGLLDEVVIYNRALTADEVLDHVNNPTSLSNCTTIPSTNLLNVTNVGEGNVTSEPAGIDCGATCSADFDYNTLVTLTATPAAGWTFSGWSGDCNGTTCQVTMDQTRNITSTFSIIPPTCYSLTLGHFGSGTDPVATPANSTSCPNGQYISGETIFLSGTVPDIGWEITGWAGTSDNNSTVNTNSVVMPDSEHSASVIYSEILPSCNILTLSSGSNGGDPTADPTSSTGCDPSEYVEGEVIVFTAHPDPDYRVANWTGTIDDTSTSLTNHLTMPGNPHSVSVNYSQIAFEHQIALLTGWNLVSFNLRPTETAIFSVLGSLEDSYSLVYAWDADAAIWLKYDPMQDYGNTLINLDETMGFWILMTRSATLIITGTKPANTSIDLSAGWNLIGYPSSNYRDLPSGFTDNGISGDDLKIVMSYQAQDVGDPWKMYDNDLGGAFPYVNDLVRLSPGWGFWVHLDNPGKWNIDFVLP